MRNFLSALRILKKPAFFYQNLIVNRFIPVMDFRGEFKNLPPLNQDYFRYLNAQNPGTFLNLNSPLFGGLQQQLQEQFVNPNQVSIPTSSTNNYNNNNNANTNNNTTNNNNDETQRKRSIKCSEPKKRVSLKSLLNVFNHSSCE